ncbi:MAG: FAD-binding protein [Clostridiales bacterium]|nr:FAD-binding protein [Clostridiales bacterium]
MKAEYDVVIVGTGVAGLYAAMRFADKDISVLLISKRELELSNSSLAQGGIACVLDKENDDYMLHFNDTLVAGKNENNKEAVNVLVTEGPSDVLKLKDYGVDFDTAPDGTLAKTLEAGHSRNRIVYHKDSTGKAVVDALISEVKKHSNIDIAENTAVYTILKADNGFLLGMLCGEKQKYTTAHYCMLCTGGIGRVYKYTTNSAIATGDGIMLAAALGAKIKSLSYIQFHPTAFAAEENRERFLISESVRGEGAVLLNCDNEMFTKKYDERGDLAPRDVVSNAIIRESKLKGNEHFYLDITNKPSDFLKNRFPMIYKKCLEEGIDITKDKIPVFPCQHYLMGGIDIDLNAKTTVDRLYAAGECSHSGVHGANRLASNSLLEALVFSRRGADDIIKRLKKTKGEKIENLPPIPHTGDKDMPKGLRTEIRSIMQNVCFVIPEPELEKQALERVQKICDMLNDNEYKPTRDLLEAKSLAMVALTVLKESVEKNNA